MNEYDAALNFMRLSDTVRVLEKVGLTPSYSFVQHCNEAASRYETARSGRDVTAGHVVTFESVQRVDMRGLVRAVCSCGHYVSAATTPGWAFKCGNQHVTGTRGQPGRERKTYGHDQDREEAAEAGS